LAKRYSVDATTILRTTQVLGYKSFADFVTDLRQHFVARITPYTALKAATKEKRSVADHIDHALDKALENLNVLKSDLDRQRLIELARVIKRLTGCARSVSMRRRRAEVAATSSTRSKV
jgi:DNA-binding MurR/RpiR family transcriptional regulator